MEWRNPYSEAYEALSDVIALKGIPRGAAARLSFAAENLRHTGASEHALLGGRASVALLRLEHAIRDADRDTQRALLDELDAIFQEWTAIPLASTGIFVPRALAA